MAARRMTAAEKLARKMAQDRERSRRKRQRHREGVQAELVEIEYCDAEYSVGALASWAEERLVIPPGHPLSGQPMALPDFGLRFLGDAMGAGVSEAMLCIARKNAKSAIIAVFLLGHLVGPLRRVGWRGGVVSVTRDKAVELKRQMQEIAEASGLEGLSFRKTGLPTVQSEFGAVDVLAADKNTGHASGFDLVVIDELGLLLERDREFVQGMKSSTSARHGRLINLTIHGPGPFVPELLARKDDPSVVVHHYCAAAAASLDDELAWRSANPGLGTIKQIAYMRDQARGAMATPANEPYFRAHDMNQPADPGNQPIVTTAQWLACEVEKYDELPPREGPCWLAIDLGGSTSMTAGVLWWPDTGRLEAKGAFPDDPMNLQARGIRDGVGTLYSEMAAEGSLRTFPGKITPVLPMLHWLADQAADQQVEAIVADRYRKTDLLDSLDKADLAGDWRVEFTIVGAGPDGGQNVRTFQKLVIKQQVTAMSTLLMRSAIRESKIVYDRNLNPGLEKDRAYGRIDPLQAAVLAVGSAVRNEVANQDSLTQWTRAAERHGVAPVMGI